MRKNLVFVAVLMMSAAALPAWADTAYSPDAKNLAGPTPFTASYLLDVTAPTSLGGPSHAPRTMPAGGVLTEVEIRSVSAPAGVIASAAEALVSVSDLTLLFTSLGQTRQVTVYVTNATVAGEYAYTLKYKAPNGTAGWGNGEATLNLDLTVPTATDLTPPTVNITAPTASTFTLCATSSIGVTVAAQDSESFVTAMAAWVGSASSVITLSSFTPAHSVSASGAFTPSEIGNYTIYANATSAGGTSTPPAQLTIGVGYDIMWLPPLSLGKVSKGGAAMPIKFLARDCNGTPMLDTRVRVKVFEGAAVVFDAVLGDGSDAVRLDETTGQYIANFQTAAGARSYEVKVYFNGLEQASKNFQTR